MQENLTGHHNVSVGLLGYSEMVHSVSRFHLQGDALASPLRNIFVPIGMIL